MPSNQNILDHIKEADDALSRAARFYARGQLADALAYAIIARDKLDQIIGFIKAAKK